MAGMDRQHRRKSFVVIGLGRFGSSLARTLYEMGYETLAVDSGEMPVQEIADFVTYAVQADCTDIQALRSLGIRNMDVCVIGVGDLQTSILATVLVKELGVPYVVAKASSEMHGKVLDKVGADRVVYPERDMGYRMAHNLVSGSIVDYIELVPGYSIVEVEIHADYVGRTLRQVDLRAKYGINVMAVRRGDQVEVVPEAEFLFETGDILVAMGPDSKLEKLVMRG